MNRHKNRLGEAVDRAAGSPEESGEINLTEAFGKASGAEQSGGDGDGDGKGESSKAPKPKTKAKSKAKSKPKIRRYVPKKNKGLDRGR